MADMVNKEKKEERVTVWSTICSKCRPIVDFVVDISLMFILTVLALTTLLCVIILTDLLVTLLAEVMSWFM